MPGIACTLGTAVNCIWLVAGLDRTNAAGAPDPMCIVIQDINPGVQNKFTWKGKSLAECSLEVEAPNGTTTEYQLYGRFEDKYGHELLNAVLPRTCLNPCLLDHPTLTVPRDVAYRYVPKPLKNNGEKKTLHERRRASAGLSVANQGAAAVAAAVGQAAAGNVGQAAAVAGANLLGMVGGGGQAGGAHRGASQLATGLAA